MKHKDAKELKCSGKRGKTKNEKRRIKNNESMKKKKVGKLSSNCTVRYIF